MTTDTPQPAPQPTEPMGPDFPAPAFPPAADEPKPAPRRLTRSQSDRMLGGVCGGLAEYFGWDSTWVRVAFVASIVLPGPQVLLYALLWLVIPQS